MKNIRRCIFTRQYYLIGRLCDPGEFRSTLPSREDERSVRAVGL